MEKGDRITETEEIQRTIRTYFKNLYSTRLENLKEIDNFLELLQLINTDKHFQKSSRI
jgi:hypothetical protein